MILGLISKGKSNTFCTLSNTKYIHQNQVAFVTCILTGARGHRTVISTACACTFNTVMNRYVIVMQLSKIE